MSNSAQHNHVSITSIVAIAAFMRTPLSFMPSEAISIFLSFVNQNVLQNWNINMFIMIPWKKNKHRSHDQNWKNIFLRLRSRSTHNQSWNLKKMQITESYNIDHDVHEEDDQFHHFYAFSKFDHRMSNACILVGFFVVFLTNWSYHLSDDSSWCRWWLVTSCLERREYGTLLD